MGPSGSGKTTLINILRRPGSPHTSGRVTVDGVNVATLGERELTRYRGGENRLRLPAVPSRAFTSPPSKTLCWRNIFHSTADEAEAAQALKRVGLGERLHHLPNELSGGEQQPGVVGSGPDQPSETRIGR